MFSVVLTRLNKGVVGVIKALDALGLTLIFTTFIEMQNS